MEEQFVNSRPAVGESSGLGAEAWRFSVKKHKGRKGLGCVCVGGSVWEMEVFRGLWEGFKGEETSFHFLP